MTKITTKHRGMDYGTSSSSLGPFLHYSSPTAEARSIGYERAVEEALSHFDGEGSICYVIRRSDGLYVTPLSDDGKKTTYTRLFKNDKGSSELEADVLDLDSDTYPAVGWFQDSDGELYYHEGEGHWQGLNLAKCKQLNRASSRGELEFIS